MSESSEPRPPVAPLNTPIPDFLDAATAASGAPEATLTESSNKDHADTALQMSLPQAEAYVRKLKRHISNLQRKGPQQRFTNTHAYFTDYAGYEHQVAAYKLELERAKTYRDTFSSLGRVRNRLRSWSAGEDVDTDVGYSRLYPADFLSGKELRSILRIGEGE